MLLLTETAEQAVRQILSGPEVPEGAGLRITTEQVEVEGKTRTDLRLSLTQMPADTDQVIENPRVFIESQTAEMLSAKILDADTSSGELRFSLLPQAGPTAGD